MNIKKIFTFIYGYFILIYLEISLRFFTIGSFDRRVLYAALFCLPLAAILYMLTLISKKVACKIIYNLAIIVFSVYFSAQLVYYTVFRGYFSVSLISMGGAAVTNFTAQLMNAIGESVAGLIALLLPIVLTVILTAVKVLKFEKTGFNTVAVTAACSIVVHMLCLLVLTFGGVGVYTAYDAYYSGNTSTGTSVQNLGVFVTTRLEVQRMLMGKFNLTGNSGVEVDISIDNMYKYWNKSDEYNVIDINFDDLPKLMEDSSEAEKITGKISRKDPTNKNQYTGIFEGYNLISICAEAFSSYLIDEELTPTLYKLSNEGFVFNNYYGSYESVTTDGEYAFCLGIYPDPVHWSGTTSFNVASDNALPYALGNMFSSIGVDTFAYHNNNGTYYVRNKTHPNMGYKVFKTPDAGIDMEMTWPSSDLEMIQKTVDDYITSGKQFHTYYMTFSGHAEYDWNNPMSAKNRDVVESLDYSEEVKAYIACNLELEYALEYLMERIGEAGIADKTVIVLTNDHYPYGLTPEQFNELAGREVDPDFEKYQNSFICWCGGMEEPIEVDKLCSTVDILPTLLNLFGFEYDSRFIVGRDVFSDYEGMAILSNQSFITEDYMFDAVNNKLTMLTDEEVSEDGINAQKEYVINAVELSKSILDTDYYKYLVDYLNANKEQ